MEWQGAGLAALGVAWLVLVIKAQLLAVVTAATRGKVGRFINAEDAAWLGGSTVEVDDPQVQRLARAHRNDLEALVPFLAVSALYVVSGASPSAAFVYFGLFVLARLAHSFAYLGRRPQLRRYAFTVAWFLVFVIGGHALVALWL